MERLFTLLILSLSARVLPSMTMVLVRGAEALDAELMGEKAMAMLTSTATSTRNSAPCIVLEA
jgi:hypothetical protein